MFDTLSCREIEEPGVKILQRGGPSRLASLLRNYIFNFTYYEIYFYSLCNPLVCSNLFTLKFPLLCDWFAIRRGSVALIAPFSKA